MRLSSDLTLKNVHKRILWGLVALGLFLHANNYFDHLSFWADEAWVALELNRRSLPEIFFNENLSPHYAVPPVGFLLIVKSFILLLGNNEYAFRLFPFICGLASLLIYHALLKKNFNSQGSIIALMLLVFCNQFIFYSAQLKQYASDVLVTMIIYLLCFNFLSRQFSWPRAIFISLVGSLCLTLSHPAILTLGGIMVANVILLRNEPQRLNRHLILYGFWFIFFIMMYFFYYRSNFSNPRMLSYQHGGFLALTNLPGLGKKMIDIFNRPCGLSFASFVLPVFCLGVYHLFKKSPKVALQLIMPFIITIIAAFLHKYPFQGRFLLFLIPIVFVIIGEGFAFLWGRHTLIKCLAIFLFISIIAQPCSEAFYHIINPRYISEVRPLMFYLKSHQRRGDSLYLNNEAQYTFKYYAYTLQYPHVPRTLGVFSNRLNDQEKEELLYIFHKNHNIDSKISPSGRLKPGKINTENHHLTELEIKGRTWVLFSQADQEVEEFLTSVLRNRAVQIDHQESGGGAALYLYYVK